MRFGSPIRKSVRRGKEEDGAWGRARPRWWYAAAFRRLEYLRLQTAELQTSLDTGFLLVRRRRGGLTYLRGEEQCLSDSLGGEMGILLLTVSITWQCDQCG